MQDELTDNRRYTLRALIAALLSFILLALLLLIGNSDTYGSREVYHYIIRSICASLIIGMAFASRLMPPQTISVLSKALAGVAPIAVAAGVAIIPDSSFVMWTIFILYVIYIPLLLVLRSSKPSVIILSVAVLAATLGNDMLLEIRGMPLTLPDFTVLTTATSVASRYLYLPSIEVLNSTVTAVALAAAAYLLDFRFADYDRRLQLCGYGFLLAMWVMFAAGSVKVLKSLEYDNTTCGAVYNLAHGIVGDGIREPEGYNRTKLEALESEDTLITTAPNLIIVMDESFSDPRQIADITTNKPIMPFYDSLTENTLKGSAVVSVFGGGTCNSEFEFLTGLSMADLPDGCYPYMQYVKNSVPTLASSFSSEVYDKRYIHPYCGINYNRSKIYPLLGFDSFEDIDDFAEDADTLRGYITDDAAFDKVVANFESKPEGKKSLQFLVTIQNHSPYSDNDSDLVSEVKANEVNDHDLNSYLTLLNRSDKALERLVNYFKSVDEPTAIVYFGDHRAMTAALNSVAKPTDNKELVQHEVPFMIWTNYPTDSATATTVSMNYLSLLVKQRLNLPLNAFDGVRDTLMRSYPVRTDKLLLDKDGNSCTEDESIAKEYRSLSYYHLFDNE